MDLETYIKSTRWKYAKTMPKWPHWYALLVLQDTPEKRLMFALMASKIFKEGYDVTIGRRTYRYLNIGEFKYWSMDPTPESTDLINRAYIDDRALSQEERKDWLPG